MEAFPALRVDHVSIAVRAIAPALALLRRILPIRMRVEPRPGYDGQFRWTDFFVGDWKLELIESARPGSFVDTEGVPIQFWQEPDLRGPRRR